MVRFNFWELKGYFGKNPKFFKKESNKQIKDNTLLYMQKYGRAKWITIGEIFEQTLEQTDLFNSNEGKMFFAIQGIKNKINWATGELRRMGYPIISGDKYGKGYRYADETCDDFINVWDEKFSAWEGRKTNLDREKEIDENLIVKIIERLLQKNREKEAQQLKQVLVKYQKHEVDE